MTVTNIAVPKTLDGTFYCRARRHGLRLDKCLEDYVEANAFLRRSRVCYRCPQGRVMRETYAWDGPAPASAVAKRR